MSSPRKQIIKPGDFFSCDNDKININWFAFEFALECESFIRRNNKLRCQLRGKNIDEQAIATFCIKLSKMLCKDVRVAIMSGKMPKNHMDAGAASKWIESYFPQLGSNVIDDIDVTAMSAWMSQVEACVICPNKCLSNLGRKNPMFDDPFYWG